MNRRMSTHSFHKSLIVWIAFGVCFLVLGIISLTKPRMTGKHRKEIRD
jgi:hypothetical protein